MPPSPSLALDLPAPDARDARDSRALAARIGQACAAAGGSLGFDRFMELALYTPGLGYYASARSRFGAGGDFVTAPGISPRFAHCVARQVAQVIDLLGGGEVLEAGAGDGTLAVGVLDELDRLGHVGTRYLILERSAGGRGSQRERLESFGERVRWVDDFPPPGWRGVLIANELLDALPAHRFVIDQGTPRELGVRADGEGLHWCVMPHDGTFANALGAVIADSRATLPHGYRGEWGPARGAWVASAAQRLSAGALLLFDYGYPRRELYHPQRADGTLACHFRHRVHDDPFHLPGLQDLSIHVDFTALAESGTGAGLDLAGYTTQAHFLLDTGLLEGVDDPALGEVERAKLTGQIQRLTLPAEMGEAVKVMALTRGITHPLAGFLSRDLSHTL